MRTLSKILPIFFLIVSSISYSLECPYSQIDTSLLSGYDSSRSFDQDIYANHSKSEFYRCCMNRLPDADGGRGEFLSFIENEVDGSITQINWYADGFVITEIKGSEEGKQTVIYKNKIVGIAYPISERDSTSVIHKYPWGMVVTTPRFQEIEGIEKNPSF